ncbi:hypothetical protein H4R34_005691 [Dimargaris verticillata]|uniref:Sorting nexin C-terminal domain-containing protein n=1 Tax=Dimargaris verticillata TaxID=2761393 RepID=A0A9W8B1V9_9FUNG|nr:hypothetical protein H4R34_005691 [Dimargaris verticillata]
MLRQALWPQGQFLRDRPTLSDAERRNLCHDAELLLQEILPGTLTRLYPRLEADTSIVRLLLDPFRSKFINKHLILYATDYLMGQLFPELVERPANAPCSS